MDRISAKNSLNSSPNEDELSPVVDPPGPSDIAARVRSLKSSAIGAAAKRNRLPRTLFWSLLRCEIDVIKKRKAQQRLSRAISQ